MIKLTVCVFVLSLSVATFAAPAPQQQENPEDIKLVRYENDNNGIDQYKYTYELSNGQIHSEAGTLKEVGEGEEKTPVIVVVGKYSFVGPDGQTYWVNYTADENGYHPVIGTGPEGGIKAGESVGIDPNVFKSLVG